MLCADKDVTIVHVDSPGTYKVLHVSRCSWRKEAVSELNGTSVMNRDSFSVRIPLNDFVSVSKGDVLILGNHDVNVLGTVSIGQILAQYPDSFVAAGVNVNGYGIPYIRHIHVEG